MGWVTFETDRGGLLKVQTQHVVAIYDEQGSVKLSTTAGGVHIVPGMTVQQAAHRVSQATEADPRGSE
jgi:hypothetical protein